jgi:DNA-directed RNA polymerase specialized sigma24 family protein
MNIELYNEIFRSVNKKVRNFHNAEEITQEVFLDLAKKQYPMIENLRAFLYFVSRSKIVDRHRNHENDFIVSIEGMDFPAPEIVDYTRLNELLALLSLRERAVVECKQLTDRDGARELGISVSSFGAIKRQAKQKIKSALKI